MNNMINVTPEREDHEFLGWAMLKLQIHNTRQPRFLKKGIIYWANLGKNIGYEEDGKHKDFMRPILVIKVFNKDLFWGVPTSTKTKDNIYYYNFENESSIKTRSVILSQLKLFSTRRVGRKIHKLNKPDFYNIIDRLTKILNG